ncbi:MAG TPA: threonine/serine exporter [Moorella mulderi]|nr:threonine/serine exporter [Moorella mulderi]
MLLQFLSALTATAGFSILFNIPPRAIGAAAFSGALGWTGYLLIREIHGSPIMATFVGALIIGMMGEVFARTLKNPTTVFVIPAMLPLVPGGSAYRTMLALMQGRESEAIFLGLQTIGMAIALAVGLVMVASFARLLRRGFKKREG